MSSPEIELYGIVHVKVDFIVVLKMYVLVILGSFVWITWLEQCKAAPRLSEKLEIASVSRIGFLSQIARPLVKLLVWK